MKAWRLASLMATSIFVPFVAQAQTAVKATRIEKDLYSLADGRVVVTRYCYTYAYGEGAVLTSNKLVFNSGSCDVKEVIDRNGRSRNLGSTGFTPIAPVGPTAYVSPWGAALTALGESLRNLPHENPPEVPKVEVPKVIIEITVEAFKHREYPLPENKGAVTAAGVRYFVKCKAHWVGSSCVPLPVGYLFDAELKNKALWVQGTKYDIQQTEAVK